MKKLVLLCCILIVAAACGGGGSSLSSEDQKVVDDLAITVADSYDFLGTADDAGCVAESLVTNLGTAYIRDTNLTHTAAFDDWDPFEAELPKDKYKKVVRGWFGCVEVSTLLGDDTDLDGLSEESAECFLDMFMDDTFLDAIYDGADAEDAIAVASFTTCPSAFIDGLVAGAGWDREDAECFADELSPELLTFFMEVSSLPGDELPENSTEILADFLAVAVTCDIDLADLG